MHMLKSSLMPCLFMIMILYCFWIYKTRVGSHNGTAPCYNPKFKLCLFIPHMHTEKMKTIMQFKVLEINERKRNFTTLQFIFSIVVIFLSFFSFPYQLRMLAHPQATIRTMAMGLRWIMNVLHNDMLVAHVF